MSIMTVGIDLSKNVFAVHGVEDNGKRGKNDADVCACAAGNSGACAARGLATFWRWASIG